MQRNNILILRIAITTMVAVAVVGCISGPQGPAGPPGKDAPLPTSTVREVATTIAVSKPANGTHFVAGQAPAVTVTLKDAQGVAFTKDDFATLNLYVYGPQEPPKTKTAVKLLNAETDRAKTPHHYIDLLKNPDAKVAGNVITYNLKPVTDEEAGTYIASVWAVSKASGLYQAFPWAEFQIGTATVEKQLVDGTKCQACHKGADSGKFYFHHIDPGRSPTGNWAIDSDPVRTCKSCHNTDGYAAYSGNIADPTAEGQRTPDPIVRRVHGVHMGEHLKNTFNVQRDFVDYTSVMFPANVKNCTFCHLDDRNKTLPSRLACGACHDSVWFGPPTAMPSNFKKVHPGGPQADDKTCSSCHPAEGPDMPAISSAHKVEQPMNKIDVTLTPPRNGKFYVAGEKPVVTLVIRNDKNNAIDHTKVDESTFSTAALFVYGPRDQAKPVLTNAAKNGNSKLRASVTSTIPASGTPSKGWTFAEGDTFKIAVNGGPAQVLAAPVGLQTPDQVRDWLKANLRDVTISSNNTAGSVTILSNIPGDNSKFEIYNSPVTTKMGWKPGPLDLVKGGKVYGKTPGTTVEPFVVIATATTPGNDLRPRSEPLNYTDPLVTRTADKITYPLDDVGTLEPGTYMIYTYVLPVAGKVPNYDLKTGIGFMTFQVGTETQDKKVATNCKNCHGDTIWHLDEGPIHAEPFDTDYCLACHDYNRSGTGDLFSRVGGNSTSGWAGFGAKPIGPRVHGVHRGAYLNHPEWVYAGNPNVFNEVIFPQDIRNCTKCHSAETTGTWKTEPSRLACTSCHDSDSAIGHVTLMTVNPNPSDPYDPRRIETCQTCHGAGKEFSPDKVHNISNPYKPPYPREP